MSCSIKRILTIQIPVKFRPIQLWDEFETDITMSSMYSWSTDNVCWTNWVDYNTYNTIGVNIEGDYYLRILLMGSFGKLAYDGAIIDCYSLCLFNQNPYTIDLCNNNIDLYGNLECALLMQQQMADLICCMIGIPCYYFRVSPDATSSDVTFKEYILHNVTDMKYIKLVCEDGQLPSSKPQMTEFDFDWENDWEVEVGKTMFATAFGDTAFPKQRDIIYVPMMKRLYEVNAAYDEKQDMLMWRSTTWKLALVKWNEKTNVDQGDFQALIDNWTINNVDDFLPIENIEQERLSGTTQAESPTYAATNLINIFIQDAIRKQVTDTELSSVMDMTLNHGSAIVARNAYEFKNSESVIVYNRSWCGESGTLMMIVEFNKLKDNKKVLFSAGYIELSISDSELSFGDMQQELEDGSAYLIICNWDRATYSQSLNIYKYKCTAPEGTPAYKIRPEMYSFDFNNPICTQTKAYSNDYITNEPKPIILSPNPCRITNIRLYDIVLDYESSLRESIKYITSNEHCVFNDVARPIEAPHGYSVR